MSIETASTVAPDASHASQRICAYCRDPFTARRSWQLYCGDICRREANAKGAEVGIEVKVSAMRVLKRGALSVILRVDPIHRHVFEQLSPGQALKVLKP